MSGTPKSRALDRLARIREAERAHAIEGERLASERSMAIRAARLQDISVAAIAQELGLKTRKSVYDSLENEAEGKG